MVRPGVHRATCGCPVLILRLGRAGVVETWVTMPPEHLSECTEAARVAA